MNDLRLDDLLARDVGIQWFEGIALLQLTCRALRAHDANGSGFPSAADILVGPGGSIAISGQPAGNGVRSAAHLLARMLSEDVPVRLRLVVSQATAMESAYSSLAEFSDALAYFERPNPEAIVDELRQRAMLAGPSRVTAQPRLDVSAPEEKRPRSDAAVTPRRSNRLALAALAVSAAACATVWLLGGIPASLFAAREKIEDSSQPPAPDSTTRAHAKSRRTGGSTPAEGSVAGTPMTRAAATPATATDGRESAPDSQVPGELLASVAAPRLMLTELSGIAPSTTPGDSGVEDSNRIYSRTDPDVTPPRNVYPKFPTQSPWSDVSSRTVLELTIAKDGVVEHVRMLTTPRNIHEFMLLSAAKAWRFEPARIGGRPVRFRHTIAVDARPGVWASSK